MRMETIPPLTTARAEWERGRPRKPKKWIRILTISTTSVPQYAQGLRVHNPQASTSSITPITRGNHPKSTSLIVPVGGLPSTLRSEEHTSELQSHHDLV